MPNPATDTYGKHCKHSEIDAGDEAKRELNVTCNSPMPILHDFRFADFDITETALDDAELDAFDARKLEEFAERLLTNISADLETNIGESHESTAENEGDEQQLFGSMVGTTTECLESCKSEGTRTRVANQTPHRPINNNNTDLHACSDLRIPSSIPNEIIADSPACDDICSTTVYGTYDGAITILTDDTEDPINEIVEEIEYTKGDEHKLLSNTMKQSDLMFEDKHNITLPTPKTPSILLNSNVSDYGYESAAGSPHYTLSSHTPFDVSRFPDNDIALTIDDNSNNDFSDYHWPGNDLKDLFPDLI